ncbi:molecular chaperone DnaJ [Congregibacter litoralis]|uniref:DnaJ-class molecular chaperone with C-terminal Zn finger domain protein n=1 Tax=Congregibacter litoralis KT71 TaxID=314285 RepID=A4AAP0_9GAMM|nr:molecular chaperone DnaJ [Congregibacter litoralis]EAQ96762.1 DnaJ-class molecular chaperone with C-terminal Zn finger domain protein [Congregibacter litoralis KT71]
MPRLMLLLAVGAVAYILLRRVAAMPPHLRRGEYFKLGLGAAVVVVILLTLAGKMHWVGAAITGFLVFARQSLPLLLRLFPMLSSLRSQGAGAAQQSTVTTRILRMHLDHETGALSGEVLEGPHKDWRLEEMDREQLDSLREYCENEDPESLQLLEGYLEQRFQGEAREDATQKPPPNGAMNRKEALEILGLDDDADEGAIVDAHRKLMQKLHPDRGGSDYLAAKINQAKDFLIGK